MAFTDSTKVSFEGMVLLVLASILTPGIGRFLYFKSLKNVGVSINALIFATFPIYSTIFAVVFLNEILALENWIGLMCLISGVVFVQRTSRSLRSENKKGLSKGYFLPVFASWIVASGHVVRKIGLSINNVPLFAVAVGYTLSFLLYLPFYSSDQRTCVSGLKRDLRLFWKSGVCSAVGQILAFYALSLERVSIISPILQVDTLFIILFSYLYLKEMESISMRLFIIGMIVVLGVIFLGIG